MVDSNKDFDEIIEYFDDIKKMVTKLKDISIKNENFGIEIKLVKNHIEGYYKDFSNYFCRLEYIINKEK